jgi:hypothetical protein
MIFTTKENEMKAQYEICVVSKEYRYLIVEAENESEAKDMAWDRVSSGFTCDTKAQDYDTEVYFFGYVK